MAINKEIDLRFLVSPEDGIAPDLVFLKAPGAEPLSRRVGVSGSVGVIGL
jgi:hypothetical protein